MKESVMVHMYVSPVGLKQAMIGKGFTGFTKELKGSGDIQISVPVNAIKYVRNTEDGCYFSVLERSDW